ncbi:MAG TPA: RecX family transcriptional regulator [Sandaracinaceae bacterium LLY-WYZ-13_1]|nr:RecX family transcriptional regulator [Sandaracinaceae bacterium LLY-WYZ-13_1]
MTRRRKAKEATPAYLERVALWYMARHPGSTARVRRTLEKRVRRSVEALGTDPVEGAEAVAAVLAKLERLGLLDDARFAEARVRSLRRRGKSARAIRAALRRQGVDDALVDRALSVHDDAGDAELAAARALARKRRLGPWRRDPATRADGRERDLAKLGRAGYSFDVARRVVDEALDDPEP